MVRIEVSGETASEAAVELAKFRDPLMVEDLEWIGTDELLAELRRRLSSEDPPQVVKVLPFYETDEETDDEDRGE